MEYLSRNDQNFVLTSPLHLDFFPKDYREFQEMLSLWYQSGGNRIYLATLYNAIGVEGKFAFLLSYKGMVELLEKDTNLATAAKRASKIAFPSFVGLLAHAQKGGFLKILRILGNEENLRGKSSEEQMRLVASSQKFSEVTFALMLTL
jgi:hypothetical protein